MITFTSAAMNQARRPNISLATAGFVSSSIRKRKENGATLSVVVPLEGDHIVIVHPVLTPSEKVCSCRFEPSRAFRMGKVVALPGILTRIVQEDLVAVVFDRNSIHICNPTRLRDSLTTPPGNQRSHSCARRRGSGSGDDLSQGQDGRSGGGKEGAGGRVSKPQR